LTGDSLPAPFRLACMKFLLENLCIILVSTLPSLILGIAAGDYDDKYLLIWLQNHLT